MKTENNENLDMATGIILHRNKELAKQQELIQKHLNFAPSGDLRMASVDHFTQTGKASGNFLIALRTLMDEYAEWHNAQQPAMTEEQMEQEAVSFGSECNFRSDMMRYAAAFGYKAALRKHAAPATVEDGVKPSPNLGKCMERGCYASATRDYNGHRHFVCEDCFESLNKYFDEEYR